MVPRRAAASAAALPAPSQREATMAPTRAMTTQLPARPSTPSVRLTALVVATTAMAESGTIAQPSLTIPARGRA